MNADELADALEAEYETELSRLGSSKSLYAVTGGSMETDDVLSALSDRFLAAAETFDTWAENGDDAVQGAADAARDAAERIADAGGDAPTDAPTPLEDHLRGLDGEATRAGGLLAWALVIDRILAQSVGFFVGSADTGAADLFRDLRESIDDQVALSLSLVSDATDSTTATTAAGEAIDAAYDHYVDVLEDMGVKVKPVC